MGAFLFFLGKELTRHNIIDKIAKSNKIYWAIKGRSRSIEKNSKLYSPHPLGFNLVFYGSGCGCTVQLQHERAAEGFPQQSG